MAKYLTRKQLLERADEAETQLASYREALSRANLTIATCIHVAEGGGVEKGDASFDSGAIQRCIDARTTAASAEQYRRDEIQASIEEALKQVSNTERIRHSQAREIRRLEAELKRRSAAIRIVELVVKRASQRPGETIPSDLDAVLAGLFVADIGTEA